MAPSPIAIVASDTDFAGIPRTARRRRLRLWLRVRIAAPRLDASLATGQPPLGHAEALRAAQLVSRRERERLAAALERVCSEGEPRQGYSAAVAPCAEALEIARPALQELAGGLRSPGAVQAHGVALGRLLVTEPDSPLYRPPRPDALDEAARAALLALSARASQVHLIGAR